MKKIKKNKIISLTLCFLVLCSVAVSAKTSKDSNNINNYSICNEVDPFPQETTPPFK